MPIIKTEDLVKTFGSGDRAVRALKGVDLSVEKGEIFGVIGLSGAGKSTLIRCINRLEEPTFGKIIVNGRDLLSLGDRELRQARMDMGMIFQSFNLLSSRTVAGNVAFPLEVAKMKAGGIKKRVGELLDLVGLSEKCGAYPDQLSGGQRQRVGIARALANNPGILLCDEATSALDPQTTSSILSLIVDVQRSLGLTVVLITHEMKVITEICDRVAVMEDGRIVESGPVLKVFTSPEHETSKSFVSGLQHNSSRFSEKDYKPRGRILKISFVGEVGGDILAELGVSFGVSLRIIKAHVDSIRGTTYGTFLVDLSGEENDLNRAVMYLRQLNVNLEEG